MSRLSMSIALTALLLVPSACEQKPKQAPPAASTTPAASAPPAASTTPTAPATPAASTTPAPSAAATPSSDAGPADGAAVELASLAGQYGFDWTGAKKAKCQKLDDKLGKKLAAAGVQCRGRDPGEAFTDGSGPWTSCKGGKSEWLLFASQKICRDQLETMEANAP